MDGICLFYWVLNHLTLRTIGNAMSKIVFDFAASEGNMCVLVSAQVWLEQNRNALTLFAFYVG